MAKIKYVVKAYVPTQNQQGTNGFYSEAKINDDVTTKDLANKLAPKVAYPAPMIEGILACAADQIAQECLESNRVKLNGSNGKVMVSIYPKVVGSINQAWVDKQIAAGNLPSGTVVNASLLTRDKMTIVAGASMGTDFSKYLDQNASLEKYTGSNATDAPSEGGSTGGNTGGGSTKPDDSDNGFGNVGD